MTEYGAEAHLKMNNVLQREVEQQERHVYKLRSKLFELHSRRKHRQEETGEKIIQMGSQWIGLVHKNIKLNEAIRELSLDVQTAKKRKESGSFDNGVQT